MWYRALGFLVTLTLSLLTAPLAAAAQPVAKVWRIGFLTPAEVPLATLIEPLRTLGYVDGQTARFESRTAQNELERLPALAADLVRTPVDIIVAVSPPAIVAAKQATTTIPVVMAFWGARGCSNPAWWRVSPGPAATSQGYTCSPPNSTPSASTSSWRRCRRPGRSACSTRAPGGV